jgi:precorrin-2/cobalt-factor-2 C20-methyltransferase
MSGVGTLWGIGVGPGPAGYLPLAALEALRQADLVYAPRARGVADSVALQCLAGTGFEPDAGKLREIEFNMDPDRAVLSAHYAQLADMIAAELRSGRNVAYLTIGDTLTYSTYGYVLAALRERIPDLPHRTFPALAWPLGEGKERVLILPCPETPEELRRDIESHDIVVLMKVGARLGWVLDLLRGMGIADHCAFARRIGLPGELLASGVGDLVADEAMGYLATLLIRRSPRKER